MERGTDREREAVRERWAALEQNRRRADGLVAGLALCFAGAVLVLLASGTRICLAAQGLPGVPCDGAVPLAAKVPLAALGGVALGAGGLEVLTVYRG